MEGPELRYPQKRATDTSFNYENRSPWNNPGIDTAAVPYPHNVFPSSITGIPGHNVENVKLENLEIIYEGGANKNINYYSLDSLHSVSEAEKAYPEFSMFGELPAWGLYVRHVKGLTLKNVQLKFIHEDFRAACIFDDVEGLNLSKISIPSYRELPIIVLSKVKEHSLNQLRLPVALSKAVEINKR